MGGGWGKGPTRSKRIKKDQGRSKEITVMGGAVGGFPTRSRRIKMDQDRSRRIRVDQRRSL